MSQVLSTIDPSRLTMPDLSDASIWAVPMPTADLNDHPWKMDNVRSNFAP
jgi:hypothetical protein